MKQTIGIGAIFEGDTFNTLRDLELQIATKSGNSYGLFQPPHITLKRPFSADNKTLKITKEIMFELAAQTQSFDVVLQNIEHFGTKVVYASLSDIEKLNELHTTLVDRLKKRGVSIEADESKSMIFHSTLTMNTTAAEFDAAITEAKKQSSALPLLCPVRKLGLFLNVDNGKHWIIIAEATLNKST